MKLRPLHPVPRPVPVIAACALATILAGCGHGKPKPDRLPPATSPEPSDLLVESRPCSRNGRLQNLTPDGERMDLGQGYDLVLVRIDYDNEEATLGLARYGEVVKQYALQKGGTLAFVDFGMDVQLDTLLPLQVTLRIGDCGSGTAGNDAPRFDPWP